MFWPFTNPDQYYYSLPAAERTMPPTSAATPAERTPDPDTDLTSISGTPLDRIRERQKILLGIPHVEEKLSLKKLRTLLEDLPSDAADPPLHEIALNTLEGSYGSIGGELGASAILHIEAGDRDQNTASRILQTAVRPIDDHNNFSIKFAF